MSKFEVLSPSLHRHKGWVEASSSHFAQHQCVVPIVYDEVPLAIATMPLAFRRLSVGRYELVAVMSCDAQRNVFVSPNGQWIGAYKPVVLQVHPFALVPDRQFSRRILCLDASSGLIQDSTLSECEPFFDNSDALSPKLKQVVNTLFEWERGRATTQRAVDELAQHSLFVPWKQLAWEDSSKPQESSLSLYQIDEKVLSSLSGGVISALHEVNALSVAYAQLLSRPRVKNLQNLANIHAHFSLNECNTDDTLFFMSQNDEQNFDFDQ